MNDTYIVYIQTDTCSNITAVNSSAFLTDVTGWTQIDSGAGDKYHHAQGNYFSGPIMTGKGVYRYQYINSAVVTKPDAEIATEEAAITVTQQTTTADKQAALVAVGFTAAQATALLATLQ